MAVEGKSPLLFRGLTLMRNSRSAHWHGEALGCNIGHKPDASSRVIGRIEGRFRTHIGHGLDSFRIPGEENIIGGRIDGIAPGCFQEVNNE